MGDLDARQRRRQGHLLLHVRRLQHADHVACTSSAYNVTAEGASGNVNTVVFKIYPV